MKKILVAVDGSKESLHAARVAMTLAKAQGGTVSLLHVVVPPVLPGDEPFAGFTGMQDAMLAAGKALLDDAWKELGAPAEVDRQVLLGAPAETLCDTAAGGGYELIVVGGKGRGAVARVLLGSTADRVVHIAKQAVLVVR